MKTVLTVATVATMTLAASPTVQADHLNESGTGELPELLQREPRHQYEDRLREAQHRRAHQRQRETRHEREERLRAVGRNRSPWTGSDSV